MKRKNKALVKVISVLMTFCFVLSGLSYSTALGADNEYADGYESMSSAQKQAYLTQHLKEVEAKLSGLSRQSKETEEYIKTLDQKIKYLQMELSLADEEISNAKKRITALENQYNSNENQIKQLKAEIQELTEQSKILQKEFDESYEQYAQRERALYISGNMSTLTTLLTSKDMSTLFTRLEMIKRVAKSDKELLENLQNEGTELMAAKQQLSTKEEKLTADQQTLVITEKELSETVTELQCKQSDYEAKEAAYKQEKQESDNLLKELQAKTQTYSEYHNQDLAELEEVNREIEQAAEEFVKRMEEQNKTTTSKATTAKKQTTTKASTENEDSSSATTASTTKATTKATTQKTTASSNKLSMTFPIPSQTKITTGYGSAGYAGHTGVDFACATGSKVVAAESGYVLISKDLTNSDGSYRSYGRYIVIAHDKKNSKGDYVYTLYAHNSQRVVSEGEYVKKGQLIAYSGSTGNSTGPHCHFEVRTPSASYNDCVDPTAYLPK
ncbi:MAG: murein hydrolase activator EnvC family protein [Eubacterium sp.]